MLPDFRWFFWLHHKLCHNEGYTALPCRWRQLGKLCGHTSLTPLSSCRTSGRVWEPSSRRLEDDFWSTPSLSSKQAEQEGWLSFVSILVAGGCLSRDMNSWSVHCLPMLVVLLKILLAKCQCSFARCMWLLISMCVGLGFPTSCWLMDSLTCSLREHFHNISDACTH